MFKKLKGIASVSADGIKYAGNTVISTKEQIQQHSNTIGDWSEAMLMALTIVKCPVLHCSVNNQSGLTRAVIALFPLPMICVI